jgi:predicted transcriptional regulator
VPDQDPVERVPMTFKLPADTRRRLRIAAAELDREMQDIADQALTEWLDKHKF